MMKRKRYLDNISIKAETTREIFIPGLMDVRVAMMDVHLVVTSAEL